MFMKNRCVKAFGKTELRNYGVIWKRILRGRDSYQRKEEEVYVLDNFHLGAKEI